MENVVLPEINAVASLTVRNIPIDQLRPNPWNRTQFDPDAMKELVNSIKAGGVCDPLIVRPMGDPPGQTFEIASGNRRWLAAKQVGLSEVPCLIEDLSDEQVCDMNIITNVQREDLSPLELARMVNAYMTQFKKNQQEAAERFGKSLTWVSQLLSFLKLSTSKDENFKALKLGWDQLRALKGAGEDLQQRITKELQEGKIKPQQVARRVNQLKFSPGSRRSDEGMQHPPPSPTAAMGNRPEGPGTTDAQVAPLYPVPKLDPAAPATQQGFWGSLLSAAGQDQLDRILPWWSRTGTVIRERFTVQWFKRHKSVALIAGLLALWFMWGIVEAIFPFVAAPFRWVRSHTFTRPAVVVTQTAPEPASRLTLSSLSSVPVPTGLKAELIDGHRLRFSWNAVGPGYRYNIYSRVARLGAYDKETPVPTPKTTGVWTPYNNKKFEFVITAVDKDDRESAYSIPIEVDLQ